ncbi:MAG: CDP-glucose 4,6-dehydratase [Bdellovibrionales bacterium]|nr:CDP-glucose 4,6-dehydratase [Bdellovibrionales bacterium]
MENLGLIPGFWKGRKVLLTGHTGFKGSWMSLWLSRLGAEVTGYALPPETSPNMFGLVEIEKDLNSVIGDIRDYSSIESAVLHSQPEIIIHMAAQPLVRRSYREPLETLDTNIMGTANLLQAARGAKGLRAVLVVTSDKCYDNKEREQGYREDEPMGGHDPYSVSKGCTELVTAAFRDSFFPPSRFEEHGVVIASARAGNVFGGGDWSEDRLIPDIVRAIEKKESVEIRHPEAVRPWQFVLEPLYGYLLLAQAMVKRGPSFGEGWNFGPDREDEVAVRTVLSELKGIFGSEFNWKSDEKETPHEAGVLRLNTTKSRNQLEWSPRWNLKKGLEETARWYKAVLANPHAARSLSLELLEKYVIDGNRGENDYSRPLAVGV